MLAGVLVGSVALVGIGLDCAIERLVCVIVVWRASILDCQRVP